MFGLPNELNVHIFSFLPAQDAHRFRRLSSYFKRLSEEHPASLQKLSFEIAINGFHEQRKKFAITISTAFRRFCFKVECTARTIRVHLLEGEQSDVFLRYWKKCRYRFYELICDVFKKGRCSFVLGHRMPRIACNKLNEALRKMEPLVEKVSLGWSFLINMHDTNDLFEFLEACSRKGTPKVQYADISLQFDRRNLEIIDSIGRQYPSFLIEIYATSPCERIAEIVENWIVNPRWTCNFTLKLHGDGSCMPILIGDPCAFDLIEEAGVTFNIPQAFLESHSLNNIPAEIVFEGVENCLKFSFHKKRETNPKYYLYKEYVYCTIRTIVLV